MLKTLLNLTFNTDRFDIPNNGILAAVGEYLSFSVNTINCLDENKNTSWVIGC